jgi:hypothetical protein
MGSGLGRVCVVGQLTSTLPLSSIAKCIPKLRLGQWPPAVSSHYGVLLGTTASVTYATECNSAPSSPNNHKETHFSVQDFKKTLGRSNSHQPFCPGHNCCPSASLHQPQCSHLTTRRPWHAAFESTRPGVCVQVCVCVCARAPLPLYYSHSLGF